ncbi:marine proteobacterial sortase target protein [Mesorhizobium sp. CAU 1732]|uniref:marine proteobacterial sortase target protein n=1 Tax=Mesorhizobium sp. CAU 1732 TaxID=3140358 RepID=UPI00325FF204
MYPIPPTTLARFVAASPDLRRRIGILLHVTVLVLAACMTLMLPRQAAQAQGQQAGFVTPGEMRSGALLLRTGEAGRHVEAPRLGTDIDVIVSGPTARARVTQMFHNPTDGWVEAIYVYPLPEDGAVYGLKMIVGDRVIVGEIKERQEARAIYEEARARGQKAALTEQERPNIFTNAVANIGPGESVIVQIEYQQPVHRSNDAFSLRIPLVVAPRYNPAPVTQTADFEAGAGWGNAVTDPVPDRDRISPPVLDPRAADPVNPVTIAVHLQAGFPLGTVESAHHAVTIDELDEAARTIRLDGPVPADRDFELTWQAAKGDAPDVGLFRETVGGHDYVLAHVTPPLLDETVLERPREIVFVIDTSGSMAGTSIEQAKASLDYALGRLKPADRFNIIRFDHSMEMLHPATVDADQQNVAAARRFVRWLDADGGTEMLAPLEAALADPRADETGHVRQIVFLTDGAIGNERQLFDTIGARLGRSRIFMVGIGSAPNSHLMSRAAELGRGTVTHIGSEEQVEARMRILFDRLESPVVTNLRASFSDTQADVTPSMLPDLYRGEPVVLAARLGSLSGMLTLDGMIGDRPWTVTLPLENAAKGEGISKSWANRRITDAEVASAVGEITSSEADGRILDLALEHGLVTRLTSLVAVDATPSRPQGVSLKRSDLPLNLPAGWDFDKVFGEAAKHRAHLRDRTDEGDTRMLASDAARVPQPGVSLPQTATAAQLKMLLGITILFAGMIVLSSRGRLGARR